MSADWNAWQAQEPSSDFADRATAAIVRERLARSRAQASFSNRRPAGRSWFAGAALLACTAAGAAWGLARLRETHPTPSTEAPAPAPEPASPPAPAVRSERAVVPEPIPATPEPPVRVPKIQRRPGAMAGASADAGAPPKWVLPKCNCVQADGICACLE